METLRLAIMDLQDSCMIHLESSMLADAKPVSIDGTKAEQLVEAGHRLAAGHVQDVESAARVGLQLFDSVFTGQVRDRFLEAVALARERRARLRIVPLLDPGSPYGEFPWEALYDGERFLSCSPDTSVVRSLRLSVPAQRLRLTPPIRMLVTTANPQGTSPLRLGPEVKAIRQAVRTLGGKVQLHVERRVSKQRLVECFQRGRAAGSPFHIWHHAGHGRVLRSEEFLLILERAGQPEPVDARSLAQFVGTGGDLSLAVLNLCYSGALFGLANHLSRWNLPMVVGFKGSISDPAAVTFSKIFYPALFRGPADRALTLARQAMAVSREQPLEWLHPILLARHSDLGLINVPTDFHSDEIGHSQEPAERKIQEHSGSQRRGPTVTFDNVSVEIEETAVQAGAVGRWPADTLDVRFSQQDLRAKRLWQIGWAESLPSISQDWERLRKSVRAFHEEDVDEVAT